MWKAVKIKLETVRINKHRKVSAYKISTQNSLAFLYATLSKKEIKAIIPCRNSNPTIKTLKQI